MTAAILVVAFSVLNVALLLALSRPRVLVAILIVAALAGAVLSVYQVENMLLFVPASTLLAALVLFVLLRRSIKARGGSELWKRWLAIRLRPAFTARSRKAKAEQFERLALAQEDQQRQRQRAEELKRQQALESEGKRIVAATEDLLREFDGVQFVSRRKTLHGTYFCIHDEQPYPHDDTLALYARIEGSKTIYCVRKGQVLDDKQVFQAYAPAVEFEGMKQAVQALRKQLQAAVTAIDSRGSR